MASFEDAAAGWETYRDRDGAVTRSQLNQALRMRGFEPISNRTYAHYNKLLRLGYTEYVSINRLDIRHANDSLFDVTDRSRYSDRDLDSPGRLVIPTRTGLITLHGMIDTVSEGFATLRIARTADALGVAKAKKYNRGVLIFDQVEVERAVRVAEGIDSGDNEIDLLLEFRSLLETDLIFDTSSMPTSASQLTIGLGPNASLYRLLGAVHTAFDLFESVRAFTDLASTSGQPEPLPPSPPLRVRHIEFSNPLELVVSGGILVFGLGTWLLHRVNTSVQETAESVQTVQAVRHATAAEQRRAERHEIEMKALQLENLKSAIEVSELLQQVRPVAHDVLGIEIPEVGASTYPRLEALKDQAVEAAGELHQESSDPVTLRPAPDEGLSEDQ